MATAGTLGEINPDKIELAFALSGLMFCVVVYMLEQLGVSGINRELLAGILIGVLFSLLNFRSWKILVGLLLKWQVSIHTQTIKNPTDSQVVLTEVEQAGPRISRIRQWLVVISLKTAVILIGANVFIYSLHEVRMAFLLGVVGCLLLGSMACILFLYPKRIVD